MVDLEIVFEVFLTLKKKACWTAKSSWSCHIEMNIIHLVLTNGGSQQLWFLYQSWSGNLPVIHNYFFPLLCFVLVHVFWAEFYI